MLDVQYSLPARSAFPWPPRPTGGTLNLKGDGPGPNWRSNVPGKTALIGKAVFEMNRSTTRHKVHVNEVAVWYASMALQKALNVQIARLGLKVAPLVVDGQWGPLSDAAARAYQERRGLIVDGVVGPQTCRDLFRPMLAERMFHIPFLVDLAEAYVSLESGWDPAAVGLNERDDGKITADCGISQINTTAHSHITLAQAFDPDVAFDFKWTIIRQNFAWFRDRKPVDRILLGTVAYNLGAGGAESWDRAGRPRTMLDSGGNVVPHWATRYLGMVMRHATDPSLVAAIEPWA